jgi:hypothetical protein
VKIRGETAKTGQKLGRFSRLVFIMFMVEGTLRRRLNHASTGLTIEPEAELFALCTPTGAPNEETVIQGCDLGPKGLRMPKKKPLIR